MRMYVPENDPNAWESVMRFCKSLFGNLAVFSAFFLPAFLGAVVGVLRKDRRKKRRRVIVSILMSCVVGCGVTPLFAHIGGIPEAVSQSLAFFLGYWGVEGIESMRAGVKKRIGVEDAIPAQPAPVDIPQVEAETSVDCGYIPPEDGNAR